MSHCCFEAFKTGNLVPASGSVSLQSENTVKTTTCSKWVKMAKHKNFIAPLDSNCSYL